jgi:hypothetical protein
MSHNNSPKTLVPPEIITFLSTVTNDTPTPRPPSTEEDRINIVGDVIEPMIIEKSPFQDAAVNLNNDMSYVGSTPGGNKDKRAPDTAAVKPPRGSAARAQYDEDRRRRLMEDERRRDSRDGRRSRSREARRDRTSSASIRSEDRDRDRERERDGFHEIDFDYGKYPRDRYAYDAKKHTSDWVDSLNFIHAEENDIKVLVNMEKLTNMVSNIKAVPADFRGDPCNYAALILREIRYWIECKKTPGTIANIGWGRPFPITPATLAQAKLSGVDLTCYNALNEAKLRKQLENLSTFFLQNGIPAFLWGLKAIEFFNIQNTSETAAYIDWYTEARPRSFYFQNCVQKLVELFCGGTHSSKFDLGEIRFNPTVHKNLEEFWKVTNQKTSDAGLVLDVEYKNLPSEERKRAIERNEFNLNLVLSWIPASIKAKYILELNTKNPSKDKNPDMWRPKFLMEMIRSRFGSDYNEWRQAWIDEARETMKMVQKLTNQNDESEQLKYTPKSASTPPTPKKIFNEPRAPKAEFARPPPVKLDYHSEEFKNLSKPPYGSCFKCFKSGHRAAECEGAPHKNTKAPTGSGAKREEQLKIVKQKVEEKAGMHVDNDDFNNFRIKSTIEEEAAAKEIAVVQDEEINNDEVDIIKNLIDPTLLINDIHTYIDTEDTWPRLNDPFTLCLMKGFNYENLRNNEEEEGYLFEPNVEIVHADPYFHEFKIMNNTIKGEAPTFHKLTAYEDCLCDGHGAIRESELTRMGIKYNKRIICIETADKQVGTALGHVILPVFFLAYRAMANFLVLADCPYECIIGVDLMQAFKLRGGLRIPLTDIARRLGTDELVDEKEEELLDDDHHLSQTDLKDRLTYYELFQQMVADNQEKVPKNAYCTFPGAEIKIEFDEMVKANRFRQQFKQEKIIEDILYIYVKVWLADNICEPHDRKIHGEHKVNTPLFGVAQKNVRGEVMKVRGVFACNDSINNGLLTRDEYPMERPATMYDEAGSYGPNAFYTVVDITDAFHSIRIRQEDIGKMAFMLKGVVYVFKRAAMGLKFMPSFFQRLMTAILSGLKGVKVYIDDIWIMTGNDMNEHYELVKEVLRRLTEASLRVSPAKCKFMTRKFKGLGYIVTPQGTQIDPDRVANIREMPLSASYAALATFIFTCEFLHSRIPKFAEICKPLHDLLNKGRTKNKAKHSKTRRPPWEDSPEATNAFFKMKDMLGSAPMLWHYDPNKPLYIAVDASTTGHGSILYQPRREGDSYPCPENIVSFRSHGWKKDQRRYFQNAYRLEFMGLIQALKDHRQYIWGRKFTVFTDHKPLTSMFSEGAMNEHIASYLDVLMEYDFDIMYIPGESNILPDGMSRMRQEKFSTETRTKLSEENKDSKKTIDNVNNDEYPKTIPKILSMLCALKWNGENYDDPTETNENKNEIDFSSAQSEWNEVEENTLERLQTGQRKIISQVDEKESSDDKTYDLEHEVKICSLWIRGEINDAEETILRFCALNRKANINTDVRGIRPEIQAKLDKIHSLGHYGLRHMLAQLKLERVKWRNMNMDVREFLRSCITCAKWNLGEQIFHELRAVIAKLPWDHLQIDYITSFDEIIVTEHLMDSEGYKYILVIVDIFTGFTVLKPCKTRDASECAKILWEVYQIMGVPKILQSDNDKSFVSALMKNMCDTLKQVKLETHPYTHRELGKAESMVKIVSRCLRTLMTDLGADWIEILPVANIAINATIKELTGLSPYMMMFNRPVGVFEQCKLPVDVDEDISLEAKNRWLEHQRNVLEQLFPATRERINAMKQRYKMDFAKKHKIAQTTLPIGAKVMLKELKVTNKNCAFYHSLFEVIKVHEDYSYDIKDAAGNTLEEQPIDHLKVLPIGKDALGETYLVDRIIASKKDEDNKWVYKVRYLGYDSDEDRWVHVKDISDALINNYWKEKRNLNSKKRSIRDAEFEEKSEDEDEVDEVEPRSILAKKTKLKNTKIVEEVEFDEDDELLCDIEPANRSRAGRNRRQAVIPNIGKM